MIIDFKKAFIKPFTGEKWFIKLLVGSAFMLLNSCFFILSEFLLIYTLHNHMTKNNIIIYLGLLLITCLSSFIVSGYVIQYMHNEISKDNVNLPQWKNCVFKYFKNAAKSFIVNLGYTLYILVTVSLLIGYLIWDDYLEWSDFISPYTLLYQETLTGFYFIFVFFVILALFIPFIEASFAENFRILEALNLVRIAKKIYKVWSNYIISLLIFMLTTIFLVITILILCMTGIGILFSPFLTFIYLLITMNIFAQTYKVAISCEN